MATIEQRVDLGLQLLDREVEGWRDRIDSAILDINSLNLCPLGQLFGGFQEGAEKLGLWESTEAQIEFGFDAEIKQSSYNLELELLTNEWKRRLGADK